MELTVLMTILAFAGCGAILLRGGAGFADFGERTAPQRVPFAGGSEPRKHAWSRYHIRYYPMVLLLIAFEMEMMFMYPWAVVFVAEGAKAMAEMGMFLSLLGVGLLYGWREGAFRWQ